MSSQFLGDLNDFISPSQACIKPVPSKDETLAVSIDMSDGPVSSDPVTISLNDCLACSGCITSAESVLISQQTYLQLYSVLETNIETIKSNVSKPKMVIVSVSPQSRTALAARFGLSVQESTERITSFLKWLGVDFVFDTNFGRDICLHECPLEFLEHYQRLKASNVASTPLLCGACPGWICYAEKTQPQLVDQISRVKSPQQIMGTLSKYFFASRALTQNISPSHIFHVTIMPCYDKKLEASRPDFFDETYQTRDVDCVISTSELMKMIEEKIGIDGFLNISRAEIFSSPQLSLIDECSGNLLNHGGSGSGGYLEHVLKFASKRLFNVDLIFDFHGSLILAPDSFLNFDLIVETQRNSDYQEFILIEKASSQVLLRFAKVYGFRNVQNLVRKFKSRKVQYDYVEVMACPDACLNGGGQLRPDPSSGVTPKQNLDKMQDIYIQQQIAEPLVDYRIETVYREWLGGYGSPLLRTNFRAVEKTLPTSNFSVQW
jgi:iron only hydrogenase large subunit-like protein